jgi:hypothetical protein
MATVTLSPASADMISTRLWVSSGTEVRTALPAQSRGSSSVAEKFHRLAAQWRAERGPTSSISQMAMHPAYQQIIGMGLDVVPIVLGELSRELDHWFWALKAITGVDPVPPARQGRMRDMAEAWLHWGRQQGYLP